jgi:SAM-dependent MidA family methyltransferase
MSTPEQRLRWRIRDGGPLPFAEFMEEALYGEGGYYRSERSPIGPAGDFITGSSLSPLFGRSTARLLERLAERLGRPADLLEVGCGDGRHLAAVLETAEPGVLGRVLGHDRVSRPLPAGVTALKDFSEGEEKPVRGLVFSYELFDALPVRRFRRGVSQSWEELRVGLRGESFDWDLAPVSSLTEVFSLLATYTEGTQPGQIVDLAPGWRPLYRSLLGCLEEGLLVTCDYGFERHRLLDARVRRHGTLACYRRQTVHRNPFVDVGRQDLTAHVDFTALIEEGEAAGLETVGLVSQAEWLGACGVFEGLAEADQPTRLEATRLLDPGGMGTEIRVLIQARGGHLAGLFDVDRPRFDK